MIRGAQNIRKIINWDDVLDATTTRAYLTSEHEQKELNNALIEVKRGRGVNEVEIEEPTNKKNLYVIKNLHHKANYLDKLKTTRCSIFFSSRRCTTFKRKIGRKIGR